MVDSETSKQVRCVTRFVEAQQNLPSDDLGGMDDELMDTQQEEEQECVYGEALKFVGTLVGSKRLSHAKNRKIFDDLISQVIYNFEEIFKKIR